MTSRPPRTRGTPEKPSAGEPSPQAVNDAANDAKAWRATVFLPQTRFPMRGRLAQSELEILRHWDAIDLFARQREQARGREKYILHDGPPYANGELHMGHALNKILKDIINRSRQSLGFDAHYVPGWDCHGLPIEWKVEEAVRASGRTKEDVDAVAFRRECRVFAEKWIAVQAEGFRRLGIIGNWERPYTTMSPQAEAQIVRELGKFLESGSLYRGVRPVLWSVPEKTALADAEVEYRDHNSPSVWIAFPVAETDGLVPAEARAVIWTTTPWTLPGNRAVACRAETDYTVLEVQEVGADSGVRAGDLLLVAAPCVERFVEEVGIVRAVSKGEVAGKDLARIRLRHPLHAHGYEHEVPILVADFVTLDQGTGLVHIAPAHGQDDHHLGLANKLACPAWVDGDSRYTPEVPLFAGCRVLAADGSPGDADKAVLGAMREAGALLASKRIRHSYPHSWRSKAPLIFRVTPQWFISMETGDLRKRALEGIEQTKFFPPESKTRLRSMVEDRPDWCVSRQRLWGVPLPLFIKRETGEVLRDPRVIERIASAYEQADSDLWFTEPPERWLAPEYDAAEWSQERDIVEVWFDSGATHSFVLEARPELKWPADLYLEGTDQHRGWFQSSLLESCGTRGRPPYDGVLTHGFLLNDDGQKMSKSEGNALAPAGLVARDGADILRLWVVASDYTQDLRVGPSILTQTVDTYRKLRNTLRYLLGARHGFSEAERIGCEEMPALEVWLLHRIHTLEGALRAAFLGYDFHRAFVLLHRFAVHDLSAFYFDVRKDVLYCDHPSSARRRAVRTCLDLCFDFLSGWLAPILSFTAEEAWLASDKSPESVHLRILEPSPEAWRNEETAARIENLRRVRRVATGAIERARERGEITAPLAAGLDVYLEAGELRNAVAGFDIQDLTAILLVSDACLKPEGETAGADGFHLEDTAGAMVVVRRAEGAKCGRCWRVCAEAEREARTLCLRCAAAVDAGAGAA